MLKVGLESCYFVSVKIGATNSIFKGGLMKSILLGLILISSFTVQTQAYPLVPNPKWAQGHLCDRSNPDYETDRYSQKIPYCRRNVESDLKQKLYDLYNIPENCRNRFTIDHIIPLSIGGDNSPENLWPEHKNVKATRPMLEEEIFGEVRDGRMSQEEAVQRILAVKRVPVQPKKGYSNCD